MESNKIYNPYDFANPILEASLLVGREKEMDEIKYYLDNAKNAPRPINIALLGQRASGKTSILNITEIEAKKRGFCTVRINFDEDDARNQMTFFYKLFDSIFTEACQNGAFGGSTSKTYDTYLDAVSAYIIPEDKTFSPFSFPIQYAKAANNSKLDAQVSDHTFRIDLIKVQEELNRTIVLLFDEGNILAQSRVLLQKLRNVFMNTPGFMLVMTGTPDLFPVMDDVFSPIVRQFKKININEFQRINDTRACIRRPLEKLGIDPEKIFDFETYRDVSEIHNLSGGKPYEIQLICHMLFRRIQFKRAETMKLDFSLLEEVRRELETWQDIASRPVLTKVRNLRKKQLTALGILCSCDGYARFEQIWGLEYIFNGNASWTSDSLEKLFQKFIDEGILKVENDLISFAGDEFDKIYAKYFAREQGTNLGFSRFPPELKWQSTLASFLEIELKDRLETVFTSYGPSLGIREIFNIIDKLQDENSNEDIFVDNEQMADIIYSTMVEYQNQTTLIIIVVNLNLPWLTAQTIYRAAKPADSEALEEAFTRVMLLSERITELGGSLVVERNDLPVIPLAVLVDKVGRTANESARLSFSAFHIEKMRELYIDDREIEKALLHANLSYQYNPELDSEDSNDIGYVFLSAEEFHTANILFKRAIDLGTSENSTDSIIPALPTYNLGVLQAELGQLESALTYFQLCIDASQSIDIEDREMVCLWVPIIINTTLTFEERKKPDLLKTAEEAKITIEYAITLKNR